MLNKIRTLRNIVVLSTLMAGSSAYGTAAEFVELCSVSHLPRTTVNTIGALKKFVQGWEHGEITCSELVQKLQEHKSLHLPGQTFHYYHVTDLTPISLLDWIEELEIPSQQPDTLEPLTHLTNLKKLDITGYEGDQFVVSSLSTLTELSITLDSDAEPIDLVTPLANLKTLSLDFRAGKYNLNVLPQSIETLALTGLGLKSLRGIETLYQLRDLEIQGVKLRSLRGIESLPQRRLERLVINSSEIGDFSALAHLENQTELTISYTNLTDISFISKMITLQRADLSFNKINDLHPIANVLWLEHLNLGSNQISTSTPLDNLTHLKALMLNHNFLPFIKLGNWPRLEILDLTKNNLGHGPQLSMEPWQYQIKELGLGMNELRELDAQVAKIQSIQTLGIDQNRLANVVAISNLANLETLNVADNKIVDLSPLTSLTKLKELTFYDNPVQVSGCPVQPTTICTHP